MRSSIERSSTVHQSAFEAAKSAFRLSKLDVASSSARSFEHSDEVNRLPLERAYHWERTPA